MQAAVGKCRVSNWKLFSPSKWILFPLIFALHFPTIICLCTTPWLIIFEWLTCTAHSWLLHTKTFIHYYIFMTHDLLSSPHHIWLCYLRSVVPASSTPWRSPTRRRPRSWSSPCPQACRSRSWSRSSFHVLATDVKICLNKNLTTNKKNKKSLNPLFYLPWRSVYLWWWPLS